MEWSLVFLGGLAGSSHCIGMCGGFAMLIGLGAKTVRQNLFAQLMYSLGRIFTYAVIGGAAGFLGSRLGDQLSGWVSLPAILSVAAGLVLIVQGLATAGVPLWRKSSSVGAVGCMVSSSFATFLKSGGYGNRFLVGVLNGFLPCGLLYGFLTLAAATGDALIGAMIMAVFGFGTVPLMVLTGLGGSMLSVVARQRILRIAAVCVVMTGGLTLYRGAAYLMAENPQSSPCPFCASSPTKSEN